MIARIIKLWRWVLKHAAIRYLLTGGVLFLIDLAVFLSLKHIHVATPIAQATSRTVGATVGFTGHKAFSFQNREKSAKTYATQGTGYVAITIINIVISPVVVTGIEHFLPGNLPLVKVIAEVVMVTETYFVLRWIFKKK